MLERFTEKAHEVVLVAQEEARLMHHAHIGTEHLLVEQRAGRRTPR
jgi:ATP-dependent Clp protease ATP-binding subunit ClpC